MSGGRSTLAIAVAGAVLPALVVVVDGAEAMAMIADDAGACGHGRRW